MHTIIIKNFKDIQNKKHLRKFPNAELEYVAHRHLHRMHNKAAPQRHCSGHHSGYHRRYCSGHLSGYHRGQRRGTTVGTTVGTTEGSAEAPQWASQATKNWFKYEKACAQVYANTTLVHIRDFNICSY